MPFTKEFRKLLKNVEKTYLGKPVKKKYQDRYGLRYDEGELEEIAFAIAKSRGIKIDKRRKK